MIAVKIQIGLAFALAVSTMAAQAAETPKVSVCGKDALGTGRTLVVGTKGGVAVGLESYPRTLPLADHEVVLTFDDGPGATTPAVLDALDHECVHATFFLVGRNAEAQPALVQRELMAGHTLGHHTFSHPARTLRRMSFADAQAEIERGFAADDKAAYGASAPEPRVKFFRFPGFADTPALVDMLQKRDIAIFGTDLWADDWLPESPERELALLMRRLDTAKRGIILLHDTRRSTARMLPNLLRALKAGGYRVVHIVPGPAAPATVPAPESWNSTTDPIIASVFAHKAAHRQSAHGVPTWMKAPRHGMRGLPQHSRFARYNRPMRNAYRAR